MIPCLGIKARNHTFVPYLTYDYYYCALVHFHSCVFTLTFSCLSIFWQPIERDHRYVYKPMTSGNSRFRLHTTCIVVPWLWMLYLFSSIFYIIGDLTQFTKCTFSEISDLTMFSKKTKTIRMVSYPKPELVGRAFVSEGLGINLDRCCGRGDGSSRLDRTVSKSQTIYVIYRSLFRCRIIRVRLFTIISWFVRSRTRPSNLARPRPRLAS